MSRVKFDRAHYAGCHTPLTCGALGDCKGRGLSQRHAKIFNPGGVKPVTADEDPAISPDHYKAGGIEPIDFILTNDLGFCEGNIVKYVSRWRLKNGVQDLKKARRYLDFLIADEERKISGAS